MLVGEVSAVHAAKLRESIERRKMDNLSVLAMEKEVRGIIGYYEGIGGVAVMDRFRLVLLMCSVMMMDTEEEVVRFLRESNVTEDD
jgi:hypothetical protein